MAHKVLLGADYFDRDSKRDFFFDTAGLFSTSIDLFNPVYGQVDLAALQSQPSDGFVTFNTSWYGLYFQDQITLWDRVHILGGGRYDWSETGRGFASTAAEAEMRRQQNEIAEEAFSPRVGLVYPLHPREAALAHESSGAPGHAPSGSGRAAWVLSEAW